MVGRCRRSKGRRRIEIGGAPWQFLVLLLSGWVNREQQKAIEYLKAENRVLRSRLPNGRIRFTDAERRRLGRRGRALGHRALSKLDCIVAPDTILRWYGSLSPGRRWQQEARTWPTSHDVRRSAARSPNGLRAPRGLLWDAGDGRVLGLHEPVQTARLRSSALLEPGAQKFLEAEDSEPELSAQFLDDIRELFGIEHEIDERSKGLDRAAALAVRAEVRGERSRDVVNRIGRRAAEVRVLPRSPIAKALTYLENRWDGLTRFVEDPRVPMTSNAAERALRGLVLGRSNPYGSRSKRGTEVAAIFYSLVESAKLNGIDPAAYLRLGAKTHLRGEVVPLPHEVVSSGLLPTLSGWTTSRSFNRLTALRNPYCGEYVQLKRLRGRALPGADTVVMDPRQSDEYRVSTEQRSVVLFSALRIGVGNPLGWFSQVRHLDYAVHSQR